MENIRPYKVLVYSLQDEYMVTIKGQDVNDFSGIQSPKLTIKDDGTESFSFSIPMQYRDKNGKMIDNPNWSNVENGTIMEGLRKIKVVLNENDEKEAVYEFIINKVEETHDKGVLTCNVNCDGLAFNELGKNGYKLSFSSDGFLVEYGDSLDNWLLVNDESEDIPDWDADTEYEIGDVVKFKDEKYQALQDNIGIKPIVYPTIDYWMEKVVEGTDWSYEIQLDNSQYPAREDNKIYEDEYVSSWEYNTTKDKVIPLEIEAAREKERIVESSNSNRYNITQTIAETFCVKCRYEYAHDRNYNITGKKIIFYDASIKEDENIDITYFFNSDNIKRTKDAIDTVTKLYVPTVEDTISITTGSANKSKEDYIYNFDYLKEIGAIKQELYPFIDEYNDKMYEWNTAIQEQQKKLAQAQLDNVRYDSDLTYYKNAAIEADKQYILADQKVKAILDNLDDDSSAYVNYTKQNPYNGTLIDDGEGNGCHFEFRKGKAILDEFMPITVYKNFDPISGCSDEDLLNLEGTSVTVLENGAVTIVSFSTDYPEEELVRGQIWATFGYSVYTYYRNLREAYNTLKEKNEESAAKAQEQYNSSLKVIEDTEAEIKDLLKQKQDYLFAFERMMGPAIREGNWTPDNYKDYGKSMLFSTDSDVLTISDSQLEWDDILFDYEQKAYEETFIAEKPREYYPVIYLDRFGVNTEDIMSHIKDLFISFGNYWKNVSKGMWLNTVTYYKGDIVYYKSEYYKFISDVPASETEPTISTDWQKMAAIPAYDSTVNYSKGDYVAYEVQSEGEASTINANLIYECVQANIGMPPVDYSTEYKYYVGAQLEPVFIKDENEVIHPVLLIKEITHNASDTIEYYNTNLQYGYREITIEDDAAVFNDTIIPLSLSNLVTLNNYDTVYLRYNYLDENIKTSDDEITVAISSGVLKEYEDYDLIYREGIYEYNDETQTVISPAGYRLTLRAASILHLLQYSASSVSLPLNLNIHYTISTADLQIYLDALQVSKENAFPKVEYTINVIALKDYMNYLKYLYMYLDNIVNINDFDLHLNHVQGYISEIEMQLDSIWEDKITVANYKTKFEDLFSKIVASSETMKRNEVAYNRAATSFDASGKISAETMQQSITDNNINYDFYDGELIINQENGIESILLDENGTPVGVVAIRGGGIYIATQKTEDGDWDWHSVLTPSGIDTTKLKAGQIDTEQLRIYAGQDYAFQLNAKGLYAYRKTDSGMIKTDEYVVHDGNGLFLVNENRDVVNDKVWREYALSTSATDAQIIEAGHSKSEYYYNSETTYSKNATSNLNLYCLFMRSDGSEYWYKCLVEESKNTPVMKAKNNRVSISWDGLKLNNNDGDEVFFADNETGNLTLKGNIEAASGDIGGWKIANGLRYEDEASIIEIKPLTAGSGGSADEKFINVVKKEDGTSVFTVARDGNMNAKSSTINNSLIVDGINVGEALKDFGGLSFGSREGTIFYFDELNRPKNSTLTFSIALTGEYESIPTFYYFGAAGWIEINRYNESHDDPDEKMYILGNDIKNLTLVVKYNIFSGDENIVSIIFKATEYQATLGLNRVKDETPDYRIRITSKSGSIAQDNKFSTIFTAHLYYGDKEITDEATINKYTYHWWYIKGPNASGEYTNMEFVSGLDDGGNPIYFEGNSVELTPAKNEFLNVSSKTIRCGLTLKE